MGQPLALLVLVGLFVIQSHGTGLMGKLFGPVMALWFGTLALLGGWQVWQTPEVLSALNPMWACASSLNSLDQLVLLGAVVLALTAPRRCTPTWATSAVPPSAAPGSAW